MTRWMTQNCYHFVIKIYSINPTSCVTLSLFPKYGARKGKMIINSLTILMIAGVGLISYFSFRLGQEVGYDQGLVDGRTAVRKYYEQVGR